MRIRYVAGSEFAPDHPFGSTELVLQRSGEARLSQARQGSKRSWSGRVEPAAFDAVLAHLEAGGFPGYEPGPITPSAHFTLVVETDSGQSYSVTDSLYPKNQGIKNALAWLDAVVRQLSGDAIPVGPVRSQQLVLESEEQVY
jgi:hypothetical protein